MNYQKIYDDICKRGQVRILPKEVYTEKHHIIPKCLGGNNSKDNLTVLTAREHFICHLILTRIHPKNRKVWYAVWRMCNTNKNLNGRIIPSSMTYERLRTEKSYWNSGENNPMYGLKGEKNPIFGKAFTEDHRKNLSISAKRRANSKEHLERWSKMNQNKVLSEDHLRQLSNRTRGENNPFYGKNHSEESKQKIKETFKRNGTVQGIKNPNCTPLLHIESQIIFDAVFLAAEYFRVSHTTIQNRIKSGEFKRLKDNAK